MIFTALIVTYNRLDKLKLCITASLEAGFNHIVVVNNASTDATEDWLASLNLEPVLHIVTLTKNTGGAGGFRGGAQYIKDNIKSDWVVLFDDDAYPDVLLLEKFKTNASSEYSAYNCRVIDREGNDCKMNKPFMKLPSTFFENIDYAIHPHLYIPDGSMRMPCVTLSFVGAIIKRDVFVNSIDYIHEELFIYYDDVYFSHHLKQNGHHFLYDPELIFTHDLSIQSKNINPSWKIYYLIRNLLLSKQLFNNSPPYSLFAIILRVCKALAQLPAQKNKLHYLHYIFKGLKDGCLGIVGHRHNGNGQ